MVIASTEGFDRDAQLRFVLKQICYPGRQGLAVHGPIFNPWTFNKPRIGSLDREHVIHEPLARDERRWVRRGRTAGRDYVSLSIAAPEFGAKTLYANHGRAAGNADPDVYALIWSPQD